MSRLNDSSWPKDVRIDWPSGSTNEDPVLPLPAPTLEGAFAACRERAAVLPFALVAPETLVWKLAGVVTQASTGEQPRADHTFRVEELIGLFEQIVVQLQDFPAPPLIYRVQNGEPPLITDQAVRLITGYSGAGKTAWIAQAVLMSTDAAAYFDVRDVPGPMLATGLSRELAARLFGKKPEGLGSVLLPGASGLEILQYISRRVADSGQTFTVVLDNVHRPPVVDLHAVVRAAPHLKFVLCGQPCRETQEVAALLKIQAEVLGGWSPDTIAAEASARGCRADMIACQRLLELTGGLPLYIQNAISIAAAEYGGSVEEFCSNLLAQTHAVETAQELILAGVVNTLPPQVRHAVAILSLSDVPLTGSEATELLRTALGATEAAAASHLRRVRTGGIVEVFGGNKIKIHDAIRLIGKVHLSELGQVAVRAAHSGLRDLLSKSLRSDWSPGKLACYLRVLSEMGEVKALVEFATDEMFHEVGVWHEVKPYLEKAVTSETMDPEQRFWALDALVFGDLKEGSFILTAQRISLMNRLVVEHGLGVEERLAVAMKDMNFMAREGRSDAMRSAMRKVTAELTPRPEYQRVFRYNAAVALFHLGDAETAAEEATKLIAEYHNVLGVSPMDVLGRNAKDIYPLLVESPSLEDDLKHLADSYDLYAMALNSSGRESGLARINAVRFYELARAPDSLIRVGQDLVDELAGRRDFIGARQVIENTLLPIIHRMKLAGRMIPVRSHYAVILAYCGDFLAANAEMERLETYAPGLPPAGQKELRDQRRIIEALRVSGPPPQWRMPAGFPSKLDPFPPARWIKSTGRNDPCPCNSGKKFKKCHGSRSAMG
jgi:hypothetical protein